jgi:hypothetical protein
MCTQRERTKDPGTMSQVKIIDMVSRCEGTMFPLHSRALQQGFCKLGECVGSVGSCIHDPSVYSLGVIVPHQQPFRLYPPATLTPSP